MSDSDEALLFLLKKVTLKAYAIFFVVEAIRTKVFVNPTHIKKINSPLKSGAAMQTRNKARVWAAILARLECLPDFAEHPSHPQGSAVFTH